MLKSSDPLYRRVRRHAAQRINFLPEVPAKDRLAGYKNFLRLEREMIIRYHRKGDSGMRVCRSGSILVDVVIQSIFRTALLTFSEKHGTLPCKCSLLGLGGYGRGELNPLSDVDIMFLFPGNVKPAVIANMKAVLVDEVLYPLWDLGFKVGHSTRNIKECIEEAQLDYKTRNSLLESRLVLGSSELHKELKTTFRGYLDKTDLRPYLVEMVELQEKRRKQYGENVFTPEPNIKNGVGGLRDYQGLLWMVQMMYGSRNLATLYNHDNLYQREIRDFDAAYDFLLRIRNELHFNSNRATDELTLGIQPVIAENLGYKGSSLERVEHLMKDYYYHARNNLRIARSLEKRILSNFKGTSTKTRRRLFRNSFKKVVKQEVDGFTIESDIIATDDPTIFDQDPARVIRLFRLVQTMRLKISLEIERLIEARSDLLTKKVVTKAAIVKDFRSIVDSHGKVFSALEEMHNLGVLIKILPEFDALHCYIQHDRHLVRYSEDQKVLNSIWQLDHLFESPKNLPPSLPKLEDSETISDLYWSLILYSLKYPGQVRGNGDLLNNKRVNITQILKRMGFESERADRILSFIDRHRKVAHFWHQSEVDDNQIIHKFASNLGEVEFAKLSFWFFYCEAQGRNPQYWEIHSLEDTAKVYEAIIEQLNSGVVQDSKDSDLINKKDMTRMEISSRAIPGVSSEEIEAHFHLLPERYFSSRNVDDVELHIQLVHQLLETIQRADSLGTLKPVIDWKNDVDGEYSIINVVTWDRLGLFYKLAGAISSVGLNILKARAISRSDHIAIDTFYVSHGKTGQVEHEQIKTSFEESMESILVGGEKAFELVREQYELSEKKGLYKRTSDFDVTLPVQVDVYYDEELKQLVVDYQGKDRIGLLYRISRVLTQESLNIDSVRIATSNGVASGTIFLTDEVKKRTNDAERITEIREKLIAILGSEIWLRQ